MAFIENTFKVVEKETGHKYECFEQWVDLNFNGRMVHRFNVGINGYHYWTPHYMVYTWADLNEDYCVDADSYAEYVERASYHEEVQQKGIGH